MNKIRLLLVLSFIPFLGSTQSSTATNNQNAPQTRFLGYNNNFPLFTRTTGITRTRLNANATNNYFGFNHDVSGHFGIGLTNYFQTNNPLTMLHIQGPNNTPFTDGQWRPWMRTGVFMRENSDAMYVGLKPEAGTNRSDAVVNWSDDAGADKLRFIFTGTSTNFGAGNTNPLNGNSVDGYEFMRMSMTGPVNEVGYFSGHIGVGPLFTGGINPQSRLHIHAESGLDNYVQISSSPGGGTPGTGQTLNDGLRIGIEQVGNQNNQTAFLKWQERTPFIIQTDWNNGVGGTQNGERMRISSIGAPGVPNPANAPNNNITRVAISHAGNQPITQPRSLLHLGYNTGLNSFPLGSTDGWRDWMDIGTFTSNGTDHVYVGLKQEGILDETDAIINWGDNQVPGATQSGPDDLRFIFTSTTTSLTGPGDPESQSNSGLEVARMEPGLASTLPNDNYGMVGIGDWSPANNPGNPAIDAKLDIDGDLRIRQVEQDNTLTRVLVIDPNDENRVHYSDIINGLACWDLNGNGLGDPGEDINGDGIFDTQDCQGIAGNDGLACWDANGNGLGDPAEDTNGDGFFNTDDCQGPPGPAGIPGQNGADGLACWDTNGNGIPDPAEDTNLDGIFDAQDCEGPQGPQGVPGQNGQNGQTGATGLACWDLNQNGVFDIATEDTDGDGFPSIGDCQTFTLNAHNGTSLSNFAPDHVAFGQDVNEPLDPGQLLNDREVPMNDFNVLFTDGAADSDKNRIGVGTLTPQAKMHLSVSPTNLTPNINSRGLFIEHSGLATPNTNTALGADIIVSGGNTTNQGMNIRVVNGSNFNTGLFVRAAGGDNATGIQGTATGGNLENEGVIGTASGNSALSNVGIVGSAFSSPTTNTGGNFTAISNVTTGTNYGVLSASQGGSTNYGIRATANSADLTSYGVYAQAFGAPSNFAGWFVGNVNVTGGALTVNGAPVITSDQMFKENINDLDSAMQIINALQPRTYTMDTLAYPEFGFESDLQMGLIAQEVQQVLPHVVSDQIRPTQFDSLGNVTAQELTYKGIEYEELIPVLIAGMQEQQNELNEKDSLISDLNDRLTTLENCLSTLLPVLCEMNNRTIEPTPGEVQEDLRSIIDVELTDKNNIVLNQNVPNPFAERTTITYTIPESVMKAQIIFYDGSGNLINSVDIDERGDGQLNVFASDLSTGIYTYSLVADGRVVMTKKMMKQ